MIPCYAMTAQAKQLHDLLRHGDRLAVVSPDGATATFAELDQQTASIAGWLAERTEPGDRVAVVADNSLVRQPHFALRPVVKQNSGEVCEVPGHSAAAS